MASPQCENGYIRIANDIMAALVSSDLSGQELRAVLFVIRKTYGFNKKEDSIALSQFMAALSISKTRASQLVRSLELRKILTVTQNINGLPKKYLFNKDYEAWCRPLRKSVTVTEKCNNRSSFSQQTVKKKCNHKRQYTKDNIQKTILSDSQKSDHQAFIDYAFQQFQSRFGEKLLIDGSKDGAIVKKLLSTYGLDKLKGLWDVFMQSDDAFIQRAGYSIGVFKTQINKLLVAGNRKNGFRTGAEELFAEQYGGEYAGE